MNNNMEHARKMKRKQGKPLISVIVPTLNEEKYIEKTLLSLKSQTLSRKKFEIIVVDSSSNDNTVKIASKHADKVIVISKKGISLARNIGAKSARGKILAFIDADTHPSKNLFKEVLRCFKNKNVVGCTCRIIPQKEKLIYNLAFFVYSFILRVFMFIGLSLAPGIAIFCRKEVFDKLGGFNTKMKFSEDFEFMQRLGREGKICILNNAFVKTSVRRIEKYGPFVYFFSVLLWTFFLYHFLKYNLGRNEKLYPPIR